MRTSILILILSAGILEAKTTKQLNPLTGQMEFQATINKYPTVQKQTQFLWCWAASIQMIFEYHGYEVPQQTIVSKIKGVPINQGGWPIEMTQALCSEWTDRSGERFLSQCRVYDVMSGKAQFGNEDIIKELSADRPLVYCTANHAMVLSKVKWVEFGGAKTIVGGELLDPSPFSRKKGTTQKVRITAFEMSSGRDVSIAFDSP